MQGLTTAWPVNGIGMRGVAFTPVVLKHETCPQELGTETVPRWAFLSNDLYKTPFLKGGVP